MTWRTSSSDTAPCSRAGVMVLGCILLGAAVGAARAQSPIPDGGIATGGPKGTVSAWYGDPTTRYAHGALGDTIEGGSLVVEAGGERFEHRLSTQFVFEDDTPRIVDLDGDGSFEIVTIRTDITAGAAVAVYGVRDGALVERAATPPIGRSNRWLSIAGIDGYAPEERPLIAVVRTPHIGGELELLELRGNALRRRYPLRQGLTSHILGDQKTSLAVSADVDGDGRSDLVLADQSRQRLVALSFGESEIEERVFDLPGRIAGAIGVLPSGHLGIPLEDGRNVRMTLPIGRVR